MKDRTFCLITLTTFHMGMASSHVLFNNTDLISYGNGILTVDWFAGQSWACGTIVSISACGCCASSGAGWSVLGGMCGPDLCDFRSRRNYHFLGQFPAGPGFVPRLVKVGTLQIEPFR